MSNHSHHRFWITVGLLAVAAVWFATRLPWLDERPMHSDETTKAFMLGELMAGEGYRYDPTEHHGPTLVYAARAVAAVRGKASINEVTETDLRLVIVLAGLAMVLMTPALSDGLGRVAVVWALLFLMFDPAFGYYSRYFIHEYLLLTAGMGALVCGWRYVRSPRAAWALGFGASVGLMFATKTTFVLMGAAAVGSLWVCRRWWGRRATATAGGFVLGRSCVLIALLGFGAIWLVFFSSFFTHARGLVDSVVAYTHALERGTAGNPSAAWHHNPWHFHLERVLWWSLEANRPVWTQAGLVALAGVGGYFALRRAPGDEADRRLPRFLVFYTLILFAIYSTIPYKTPWLVLGPMQGVVLLAGYGAAGLVRCCRRTLAKDAMILVLLAVVAHLAFQGYRACHVYPHQPYNPWVYAHTSRDVLKMFDRIDGLEAVYDGQEPMHIHVIAAHQWPMPWYLRGHRVGYDTKVPEKFDDITAPVLIADQEAIKALDRSEGSEESWVNKRYLVENYGVRPQVLIRLCIDKALWEAYMRQRRSLGPLAEDQ